jgi:hypothetical protein
MRIDQLPWAPRDEYSEFDGMVWSNYFDMCTLLVGERRYYLERSTGRNLNYPKGTIFIGHRADNGDPCGPYWDHLCPLMAQAVIFHLINGEQHGVET